MAQPTEAMAAAWTALLRDYADAAVVAVAQSPSRFFALLALLLTPLLLLSLCLTRRLLAQLAQLERRRARVADRAGAPAGRPLLRGDRRRRGADVSSALLQRR